MFYKDVCSMSNQDLALKLIFALYAQGLVNNQTLSNIQSKYAAAIN